MQAKPKVFVTRSIPAVGLALLGETCDLQVWTAAGPPGPDDLRRGVADADGLLCLHPDRIDAAVLHAGPRLKVVSTYAVGYDNIDIGAATRRGLPVGHTPDVMTETVADFTLLLMLAAARRLVEAVDHVRREWEPVGPATLLGRDLHGATLGIVGLGRIGRAVARRAGGFGMRILAAGSSGSTAITAGVDVQLVSQETLLREADFVTLHVPLTARTRHLIDEQALSLMKPSAILVNTSRGPLVDHAALTAALRRGQIAGAALDVTDPEPLAPDDPLLALPNVVVSPHVGSASLATRERMAVMAARNLLAGVRGERLPHCVNPTVYGDR